MFVLRYIRSGHIHKGRIGLHDTHITEIPEGNHVVLLLALWWSRWYDDDNDLVGDDDDDHEGDDNDVVDGDDEDDDDNYDDVDDDDVDVYAER